MALGLGVASATAASSPDHEEGAHTHDGTDYAAHDHASDDEHGRRMHGKVNPDADGDGQVTLEEFQAAGMEKFEQHDKDGNGVLTADELPRKKHKKLKTEE